jgi:hypothetical protein
LSIEIVIFLVLLEAKSEKYRSQEVAFNKLDEGLLRDYETAFVQFWHLSFWVRRFLKINQFFEVLA